MNTLPNEAETTPLIVGKVGKTYGIQGWLKVYSLTEPMEKILHYQPEYIQVKGKWQQINGMELREHGQGIIMHIPGYDNPEQARYYTNALLGIHRSQLSQLADGEYYWSDLIGLQVITTHDVVLGTVDHLFETGANDVLVVKADTKEHLIPLVLGPIVINIDLVTKVIRVDWDPEF